MCPHNSAFFAAPNAAEVLQQQYLELQQRNGVTTAAQTELPSSDTD
jgi:penicillin-binding protein 1A